MGAASQSTPKDGTMCLCSLPVRIDCIKKINYCLFFFSLFRSTCKYQTSMVLEAVDTDFVGHELAKSPVCAVWCGSRLCSRGTLESPEQQVLWVLRTSIGVGLFPAASWLLRVRQREHRDEDTRGADICVLPVGPTCPGGIGCVCFTCTGCRTLNETCL